MEPLTGGQILTRMALFCAASLAVTGLLWLGAQVAIRRGWIVRRTEPIREWVELGEVTRNLGRAVRASLPGWLQQRL
jgi:hypothetical protein